ncbi:MAG: hypothetical protein Q8K89_12505, partial [Actinomycetota bacterium]|nr:hypothetical protein [Actinomycetota bacterium]
MVIPFRAHGRTPQKRYHRFMATHVPYLDESPAAREALAHARILFTDLDGTLLGRGGCLVFDGEGRPSLAAPTAAARLNGAGLPVVVTSGRNAKQLTEVVRLLGWNDFLAEIGCVRGYDRGRRIVLDTGDWPDGSLLDAETPYDAIVRIGALARLQAAFPGRIENHAPW